MKYGNTVEMFSVVRSALEAIAIPLRAIHNGVESGVRTAFRAHTGIHTATNQSGVSGNTLSNIKNALKFSRWR